MVYIVKKYIYLYKQKTIIMTRLEKLETLVKIEEGIQSFQDRIALCQETIETAGSWFREIRDINTDKIHTYMMCIKRLNERFNKIVVTL